MNLSAIAKGQGSIEAQEQSQLDIIQFRIKKSSQSKILNDF